MSKHTLWLGWFLCIAISAFQGDLSETIPTDEMAFSKDSVVIIFEDSSLEYLKPKVLDKIKSEKLTEINPEILEGFPTEMLGTPASGGTILPALKDALKISTEYYCLVKGPSNRASATLFHANTGQQIWELDLTQKSTSLPDLPPVEGFYESNLAILAAELLERCSDLTEGSTVLVPKVAGDNSESSIQHALERAIIEKASYTLVNRDELETIGKEQLFSESPFVDPDKAVRMGNLAGAKYVFLAKAEQNVNAMGFFMVKCRLRVLDVETGEQKAEALAEKTAFHPLLLVVFAVFVFLILLYLLKQKKQDQVRAVDREKVAKNEADTQDVIAESRKWVLLLAARRKEMRKSENEEAVLAILEIEKNLGKTVDHLGSLPMGTDSFSANADRTGNTNTRIKDEVARMTLLVHERANAPGTYCRNIQDQILVIESILTEKH